MINHKYLNLKKHILLQNLYFIVFIGHLNIPWIGKQFLSLSHWLILKLWRTATATFKLAHIKDYMATTSTWNRTCFPNPPGCCMYRLPYEQVGSDIKGSRWVAFLLSVSWNWHLHTASGQRVLILFISHSRGDRYRQCLCLGQSKIRQASSGRVVHQN